MKISNFFLIIFFCLYSGNLSAEIFYIDIDKIINQTNVGKHINKEFENLDSDKVLKIAQNSLIREIIKKDEILQNFIMIIYLICQ